MANKEIDEVPLTTRNPDPEALERLLEDENATDQLSPPEAHENMLRNLASNYALVAQGGIWLLTVAIWVGCFLAGIIFFSAHVLLNSAGLALITQSILILQPTHTQYQKRRGTAIHFLFNAGSLSALLGGLAIIEINKFNHDGAHFKSTHAILGLITYLLLLAQGIVGYTQYYTPMIYGSVDRAKSIWKYHRASGYLSIAMGLATTMAATQTDYNKNVLGVPLWFVAFASLLVAGGIVPRISLKKFGINRK